MGAVRFLGSACEGCVGVEGILRIILAMQESRWTGAFGRFCNGEPGRPLLVSALLYLCGEWRRDWAAETLFLDAEVSHRSP